MTEWVDAGERLPKKTDFYLIKAERSQNSKSLKPVDEYCTLYDKKEVGGWLCEAFWPDCGLKVVAWRPNPEMPKES